ncbi:MAG: bifunctional diaminohydroxyphosphoribosylaminopyrimidine deaminase/5-amino-6-(5-phosphoribosylamino)uracil reductase RibD [Deltaproteobacteria bacterium]|nr:bifunctional diaminohydroxyphosphoribosylaminopyrimidine deaminase/5-amino-6-(5-phosphoribosylamino)uracil reductase RibD [Deltaproteobacteria bacterium]
MDDLEKIMRRALELARKGEGRTCPNPPVGAVVVRDGEIVGEGYHPQAGMPHAEIYALKEAAGRSRGADLFVTLEPCSHPGKTMACTDAIQRAGIGRVVVGCRDPNPKVDGRGLEALEKAGIPVRSGVLEKECSRLIAPFAKHIRTGFPFVTLKTAMTLDGQIATVSGDSRWISNELSRLWVHRLRDKVDAIMVGAGTVMRDDPQLTTRLPEGGRDPVRIVVDSRLEISEQARLFQLASEAPTLIAVSSQASPEKMERLRERGVEFLTVPGSGDRVDLRELFRVLGKRGVQSLLLEGGSRLNGAVWREHLVDRVVVCVAPKLLGGGDGIRFFSGPGVAWMSEATRLEEVLITAMGDDVLIEGMVPCSPD